MGDIASPSMSTILVVEDDTSVRKILKLILEMEGYNALAAPNLHVANQVYRAFKIDCILLDYLLPDGTPHDFVKHISSDNSHIPIILMTAASQAESLAENLRVTRLVKKPFVIEELVRVLESFGLNPVRR